MKTILKPVALMLLLGSAVVSCKKNEGTNFVDTPVNNPITDYDYTRDPNDYFTFAFKNKSSNVAKTEWRFGDDTLTTVKDPSHTYFSTGKFTVDLKNFSSSGSTTRKLIDLNIVADSIIKIGTTRTAVNNGVATLKFDIQVKAPVAKIVWKFEDVAYSPVGGSPVDAKTETFTYTDAATVPSRTYYPGTFNSVTVTLTSTKGSVATITRGVTTEGIAEDITQKRISYELQPSSLENGSPTSNEGSSKLVDGNTATKYGTYGKGAALKDWKYIIKFTDPVLVKLYCIANANDSGNDRDPKEWYLDGSNDNGLTWFQLDYQNNGSGFYAKATAAGFNFDGTSQNPGRYFRRWYYPVADQQKASWIRLRFPSGTFNGNDFQLSEFALYR